MNLVSKLPDEFMGYKGRATMKLYSQESKDIQRYNERYLVVCEDYQLRMTKISSDVFFVCLFARA